MHIYRDIPTDNKLCTFHEQFIHVSHNERIVGMDSYTVAQLTHILSEEAQMISDELKNNPQNMSPDIIAAKLDGLVLRMKQELRNKVCSFILSFIRIHVDCSGTRYNGV